MPVSIAIQSDEELVAAIADEAIADSPPIRTIGMLLDHMNRRYAIVLWGCQQRMGMRKFSAVIARALFLHQGDP
jgi:hypothetical protein